MSKQINEISQQLEICKTEQIKKPQSSLAKQCLRVLQDFFQSKESLAEYEIYKDQINQIFIYLERCIFCFDNLATQFYEEILQQLTPHLNYQFGKVSCYFEMIYKLMEQMSKIIQYQKTKQIEQKYQYALQEIEHFKQLIFNQEQEFNLKHQKQEEFNNIQQFEKDQKIKELEEKLDDKQQQLDILTSDITLHYMKDVKSDQKTQEQIFQKEISTMKLQLTKYFQQLDIQKIEYKQAIEKIGQLNQEISALKQKENKYLDKIQQMNEQNSSMQNDLIQMKKNSNNTEQKQLNMMDSIIQSTQKLMGRHSLRIQQAPSQLKVKRNSVSKNNI